MLLGIADRYTFIIINPFKDIQGLRYVFTFVMRCLRY